ncbi:MAG TPA: hypothetical protein VKB05_05040 [Pyrinomonadaceae bacterium]|nr:hypothetical protein [Pyrinomonadaceae bacterium]
MNGPDLQPWLTKIRESLLKHPPGIPDESQLLVLAHYYWDVGRIPECLSCVRLMEQRETVTYQELHFKGYWQLYTGDATSALKTFLAAMDQDKHDFATRLGYAYALFYLSDYRSAATVFRKLQDDEAPLNSPTIMAAASSALADGKRPGEIQVAPIPGLPPGLADIMQIALLQGVEDAIIEGRSRMLSLAPDERLPIGRYLVELYLDQDQNEQALALLDELMRAHENDGPLQFYYGLVSRRFGRREESQQRFAKAIEVGSLDPRPWGALGGGLLELERYEEGIDNYHVAIFLDRENPNFWGDLGMAEGALEHYERGREAFTKSIDLGAINFSNYFNRGVCAMKMEDLQAAIRDWQLAIATEPDHPRTAEAKSLIEEFGGESVDNRFVFGDS